MGAPSPASPFASPSWEPRFAVEHYSEAALQSAVALWGQCIGTNHKPGSDELVRYATRHPDHLLVEHPGSWHPGALDALPEPIPLASLAGWIRSWWLSTATYPAEPNFDGSEARGFCVFWAHYNCEEVKGSAGALVVLPKWIEIHK